jgi:hypothetical protein
MFTVRQPSRLFAARWSGTVLVIPAEWLATACVRVIGIILPGSSMLS